MGRISRFPIDLRRRPYNTVALSGSMRTMIIEDFLVGSSNTIVFLHA